MTIINQIQKLLKDTEKIPLKDSTGIITPAGFEATIEARAVRKCLSIIKAHRTQILGPQGDQNG